MTLSPAVRYISCFVTTQEDATAIRLKFTRNFQNKTVKTTIKTKTVVTFRLQTYYFNQSLNNHASTRNRLPDIWRRNAIRRNRIRPSRNCNCRGRQFHDDGQHPDGNHFLRRIRATIGLFGKLQTLEKESLTGESVYDRFYQSASQQSKVSFASPYPGKFFRSI
jgi:hypothetical protein